MGPRAQFTVPFSFLINTRYEAEREFEDRAGDDIAVHSHSGVDFLFKGFIWFLLIFLPLKSLNLKTAH